MKLTPKEKFLKIYTNMSLDLRGETIVSINGKPISWDVVFLEINHDTKIGKIILNELEKFRLI